MLTSWKRKTEWIWYDLILHKKDKKPRDLWRIPWMFMYCISLIYKQHPGLVILLLIHCCAYAPEPSSRWLGRWCCMRCNEQQQLDSKKNCQVWRRKRRMLHSLVMSKSIYNNFHIHRYNQRIPWKWESQDWDCCTFSGYPILYSKCLGMIIVQDACKLCLIYVSGFQPPPGSLVAVPLGLCSLGACPV